MSVTYLLALTAPKSEACEDEFSRWYEEVHIPQVASLPSVLSARRFKASMHQLSDDDTPHQKTAQPFLVLYEVTDAESAVQELSQSLSEFDGTETLDADKTVVTLFEETFSYP